MSTFKDDKKESTGTPGKQEATTSTRHLSTFKLITFSAITCALFFLLVEGLLWGLGIPKGEQSRDPFVGFSSQTKLFIKSSSNNIDNTVPIMVTNFEKLDFFQRQSFPLKKPANVRRVFCIGGSTTYGRPYEHSSSFCGWLADFLAYTDPEHKWEVINAGGISYASYRVVLLLKELIQYQPDLIISYVGQNEFLERRTYSRILGLPKFLRDLGAAVSKLHIYALMSDMIESLRTEEGEEQTTYVHKISKEVNTILDQSIGPKDYVRDDEQKKNVIDHFEFNLGQIVQLTRSVGSRLIMVAPASKLRNESPFKSQARGGLVGAELEEWTRHYESAQKLFREKQFEVALTEATKAEVRDLRYAHTHSLKGDILYNLGRFAEAKLSYQKALDEDVCTLRALTPLHSLAISTAHDMNVPIVDFDAIISKRSPNGITDDVFFLDHVHPTIEGHKILALALLKEIINSGMIQSPKPMTRESLEMISSAKMSQINFIDHSNALSNLAMLASWSGKAREGRTLALRSIDLNPNSAEAYFQAGVSTLDIGENVEEALVYFHKAISIDSRYYVAHNALGEAYVKLGRNAEARKNFQIAIENGVAWLQTSAHFGLGKMLEKENQLHAAIEHYQQVIKLDPQFYNAQKRINELLRSYPDLVDINIDTQ